MHAVRDPDKQIDSLPACLLAGGWTDLFTQIERQIGFAVLLCSAEINVEVVSKNGFRAYLAYC